MGVCGLVFGLRGLIPLWIIVLPANLGYLLALILVRRGLCRFFDQEPAFGVDAAILGAALITQSLFLHWHPSLNLRAAFMSLASAVILFRCAGVLRAGFRSLFPQESSSPLLRVFMLLGGFHVLRMAVMFIMALQVRPELDLILFGGSLLFWNLGTILLFVGLLALHSLRLTQDLAASRQEVRTLSGLLPICSHCKKIRLESSAWQPIEVYIHDHSGADFSHGICPECLVAFYPEMESGDPGDSAHCVPPA
jgi:hypothetical protein